MGLGTGVRIGVVWLVAIVAVIATGLLPLAPSVAQTKPVPSAVLPQPPHVLLNTNYTLPSGPTIRVPAGGNLQAALNSAKPGDVIILQAGAKFQGNFTLPNTTGAASWSSPWTSLPTSW